MPPTRSHFPSTHPSLFADLEANCRVAWAAFFHRYAPVIRAWCGRHRLSADAADDLTQSLMTDLRRKLRSYHREAADGGANRFRCWLRAVVRNAVADAARDRGRKGADYGVGGDGGWLNRLADSSPAEDLEANLAGRHRRDVEAVVGAVRQVVQPDTWRVFELMKLSGLTAKEVADRLGRTTGSVYVAVNRVQKMLRGEYERLIQTGLAPGEEAGDADVPEPHAVTGIPGRGAR